MFDWFFGGLGREDGVDGDVDVEEGQGGWTLTTWVVVVEFLLFCTVFFDLGHLW